MQIRVLNHVVDSSDSDESDGESDGKRPNSDDAGSKAKLYALTVLASLARAQDFTPMLLDTLQQLGERWVN